MRSSRFWAIQSILAGLVMVFASCDSGPPKRIVKGKISDGGKVIPVKFNAESKSGDRLRVWLKEATPGKASDSYEAQINLEDGTFTISGGDGRGVPAGKYKVFVEWLDPSNKDQLKGKFSEANSKIVRDMPPQDDMLTIDVSKTEG